MSARVYPADVPSLRRQLLEAWQPGGIFETIVSLRPPENISGNLDDFSPSNYARWERGTLHDAEPYWVAEPMCDLLQAAARSVPADVVQADLEPPTECGFVVLDKPYLGTSTDAGESIEVHAFLWGSVRLPQLRPDDPPSGVQGVSVASYGTTFSPSARSGQGYPVIRSTVWSMLGRSDWPVTDEIDAAPWDCMPDYAVESFREDRRIVAAMWTLLSQRGVALTHHETHARQMRRRLDREGISRSDQLVRVVTLREAHAGVSPRSTPEQRSSYTHRWIVQGHWRNQPYGPGRTLRRLQWIAPYTKGPADADLLTPEVVNAWRR